MTARGRGGLAVVQAGVSGYCWWAHLRLAFLAVMHFARVKVPSLCPPPYPLPRPCKALAASTPVAAAAVE